MVELVVGLALVLLGLWVIEALWALLMGYWVSKNREPHKPSEPQELNKP